MTFWRSRRLLPYLAALGALAVMLFPLWGDWPGNRTANRWTLGLLAVVFGMKAVLFWWMRRRMGERQLTLFGTALRDFFFGLILMAAATAALFGAAWWANWRRHPLAFWELACLRAALASAGVLVIGTGIGTAWEMARAVSRQALAVHLSAPGADAVVYQGVERRVGPADRRRRRP